MLPASAGTRARSGGAQDATACSAGRSLVSLVARFEKPPPRTPSPPLVEYRKRGSANAAAQRAASRTGGEISPACARPDDARLAREAGCRATLGALAREAATHKLFAPNNSGELLAENLKQRPFQQSERNVEVEREPGDVHERGDEWRARAGGVEADALHDEGEHCAGE